MSDINKKSLSMMDEYLKTVSDEEFMADYLALEDNRGQTIQDFFGTHSFHNEVFTEVCGLLDSEELKANHVKTRQICSDDFEYYYTANDDIFEIAA